MDFKLFPSFPTQLVANKQLVILLCHLNASHFSLCFSEYSIRRALIGLWNGLVVSSPDVNFWREFRCRADKYHHVDVNELILELALSPVRGPIP